MRAMSETTYALSTLLCLCRISSMKFSPASSRLPHSSLTFQKSLPLILDKDARPKDLHLGLQLDSISFPFFETDLPTSSKRWEGEAYAVRKGIPVLLQDPTYKGHHWPSWPWACNSHGSFPGTAASWYLFLCIFIHKREQTQEWLKVKTELSITTGEGRNKSQNARLVLVDNIIYMLQWSLTLNWKLSCCWKIEGLQHSSDKVWFKDEFYFSQGNLIFFQCFHFPPPPS